MDRKASRLHRAISPQAPEAAVRISLWPCRAEEAAESCLDEAGRL